MSATAERGLLAEWDRCRWVWNECVAKSRQVHAHNKAHPDATVSCGPARLCRMLTAARAREAWLGAGASIPQQQTIRDFAKSRAKALADIADRVPVGRRAGMPRFKKKAVAAASLIYTRCGFRLKGGRLRLAGGMVVTVVWSRKLPADPSSVRVYRDCLGHWYASFVIAAQGEPLPATGKVIGIDWGVAQVATTTSDDHDLAHAEHGKRAARKLAKYQRMMARRKPAKGQKAPKGYRTAKRQAAKAHTKVARQRQDTARKWAKRVVADHDALAVEDFKPRFLAKSTMARKAADAAIATTKQALIEMGRKHGRDVRLVHPAHTTTDCANCRARTTHALALSQRTYTCTACGASRPRDKNSAHIMLIRAGLTPAGAEGARPAGAPPPQAA